MNRILVVDDEASNIDALCGILRPAHEIIVAKNGPSAVEKAKKHLPELILLDVIMPEMSGFEVITILKNSDITHRIPVIFITGLDDTKNEEKGLLLGAVDYITKPFNDSIVKARVGTHLQIVEHINTIERMCLLDALTNIANRRCLDDRAAMEWERAARNKEPVGFLMLDIDHFKKYNDTYGHPQGDALLKSVAGVFKGSLSRPTDFAARWGGEEFAVLLPNTDATGVMEVAERIRHSVEMMVVPDTSGKSTSVTVSIGGNSTVPGDGKSMKEFIAETDQALYRAKTSGRNRVQMVERV